MKFHDAVGTIWYFLPSQLKAQLDSEFEMKDLEPTNKILGM